MDVYLKATAAVLISVVACLILSKQSKDFSILLSLCVCCMIFVSAVSFLKPVLSLVDRLSDLAKIDDQMLSILLKAVGVALLAEVSALVCTDAGNATLGRSIQILSVTVILWLSIPLLNELIDLIEMIFSTK